MREETLEKRQYTMTDVQITKRLMAYALPYWKDFFLTFFLMLVTVAVSVLEPVMIGLSIDALTKDIIDLDKLFFYLAIMLVIIIVGSLFNYLQTIILQITGQKIIYNVREEIFTHLEYQDIAYVNNVPTGSLVTRVTNDTNTLNEMFTSVIVNVVKNVLMLVAIIIAMMILNFKLTLLILVVMPFIVIASFVFRHYSRRQYRITRSYLSRVNAFIAENLSGMKIIQVFNQEEEKFKEFDEKNTKLKKAYFKQIKIFGIYRPTMYFLFMVTTIIVLYFGGLNVIEGTMTIGFLIAFQNYIGRFFEPIQQLAEQFNILQSAFASSERIFGILDSHNTVKDADNAVDLADVRGEIEFKNVSFAYVDEDWILKDVSFKVNAKESVAFVGATGAGKTTILSLISRNYDIQKGQILLDGIDIKTIKKSSLRSFIGQMLQDVFMFSGTIESNIKLRDYYISDEDMVQACEYVNANHFIEKLPKKYKEEVRERGNNFSTGQRQLLSFARTIVHKPKIMILDEATSNIDTETEQLIQESLTKMMSIGTMLIVAHRLSTIQHVDKIIVLSKGEIIEQGSHQELLREKGHYFNLYKLQYQEK